MRVARHAFADGPALIVGKIAGDRRLVSERGRRGNLVLRDGWGCVHILGADQKAIDGKKLARNQAAGTAIPETGLELIARLGIGKLKRRACEGIAAVQ